MRYKLVAFDLDGTLVKEISSWKSIHKFFGTEDEVSSNLKAYELGEIDYAEFMRRDIALWSKPIHINTIKKIMDEYTLAKDAKLTVDEIKSKRYKVAIISGGIDVLADMVAKKLGIRYTLANGFAVDKNGYLTGEGIFRVDPINKHVALKSLAEDLGLTLKECVAVGDGKYDEKFLKDAGLGIALGFNDKLEKVADRTIFELKELLNVI
ncbi:MAG: HAD-IB family phosphatase [Candidatus Bathyarchaeota archaeon]